MQWRCSYMSPGLANSADDSKYTQTCTSCTTHMWIHRWAHSKCYFTRTHRKRKVTLPQMQTAQMGQSRSSSPSVQYSSQLLKYVHKSEQTIWITLISGLRHSSLSSSFPQISWVSLATPTRTYKNLRFAAPLQLMVFGFLLITPHTYTAHLHSLPSTILSSELSRSLPLLTFRSPCLSGSCFGFGPCSS